MCMRLLEEGHVVVGRQGLHANLLLVEPVETVGVLDVSTGQIGMQQSSISRSVTPALYCPCCAGQYNASIAAKARI